MSGADVPVQDLGAARIELASSFRRGGPNRLGDAYARVLPQWHRRGSFGAGGLAARLRRAHRRRSTQQLQLTPERPGNAQRWFNQLNLLGAREDFPSP